MKKNTKFEMKVEEMKIIEPLYTNTIIVVGAIISTCDANNLKFKGLKEFINSFDLMVLLRESFVQPIIAFIVIKVFDYFFGEKIKLFLKNIFRKKNE